jgi:hypothetical protein
MVPQNHEQKRACLKKQQSTTGYYVLVPKKPKNHAENNHYRRRPENEWRKRIRKRKRRTKTRNRRTSLLQMPTMRIRSCTHSRNPMRQHDLPQVWFKISRFNVTVCLELQGSSASFSALLELKDCSKRMLCQSTTLLSESFHRHICR